MEPILSPNPQFDFTIYLKPGHFYAKIILILYRYLNLYKIDTSQPFSKNEKIKKPPKSP